jgi:MFS family permease
MRKPFVSSSLPDTDPAGVVAAEMVLQNPATLRDLLAAPSYVRFWIGAVCNRLSIQIQAIALAWQVYAVARQSASVAQASLAVGMLGLAQFLPMFALTLFAGYAADIYDRRKIMMAGLGLQLLTSALFSAMAFGGLTFSGRSTLSRLCSVAPEPSIRRRAPRSRRRSSSGG